MNVLLLEFDLYQSVGGGQTVYKRLIESNAEITFFYLGRAETAAAIRPANARLVPYREPYGKALLSGEFNDINLPAWAYPDYLEASNVAASVAHLQIDVVDIPDYKTFGYLLAPAMLRHGQKSCKVAVALHGNLSETQRVNWGCAPMVAVSTDQREQWQYRAADIRYGLSRDYLEHWQKIGGKAGHYLNPLRFVAAPKPLKWNRHEKGVSLNFIGRTEAFKGTDLFVELLAWLPPESYRVARIIGPATIKNGVHSRDYLNGMAERRGVKVEQHPCMSRDEMSAVYAGRGITVLPSRQDTFNLTALESLFAGCPIAVSSKAGICRFLRETYPGVPFTMIDVDNLHAAAPAMRQLIATYNEHRDQLAKALSSAAPVIDGSTLSQIYECGEDHEKFLRDQATALYDRLASFYQKHSALPVRRLTLVGIQALDSLRNHTEGLKKYHPSKETDLWGIYRQLFYLPEEFPEGIDKKAAFCAEIALCSRIDRARVWAELARLERIRGNDFVAATYEIRVLRLMGEDRLGMLPLVVATLQDQGFSQEAEAALALYGPKEQRLERGRRLLEAARSGHRSVADRPFEFVEDSRPTQAPRVSIIVSLYRAANKLETFLQMLAQLEWIKDGRAELVFIDSQSPTDEHAVFKRLVKPLGLTAVYARTLERETIQKAWNRGILLARAPYLSFLGVDEMIRPQCLEILATELDADPSLDWVQGNSLITEVDMHGTPQRDLMIYQRIPYDQDLVYLETCYLSWVGGMYRKSMHDRLGYYDETFGAAGDTEFKNRVLPFIKSKTLPLTLGIFLNYPEERTTQSPRAEIEDLRAWYLHRGAAGVEYALGRRGADDALLLLKKALGYRKSYRNHLSSDLDFACELAAYAAQRLSQPVVQQCAASVERVLQAYRELDWLPNLSPRAATRERKRVEQLAAEEARRVQAALGGGTRVTWEIFNDNRYEQHTNLWDAKALAAKHTFGDRCYWCRTAQPPVATGDSSDEQIIPTVESGMGPAADSLIAALRAQVESYARTGTPDMVRDLNVVAQYLQGLAEGKPAPVASAPEAGSVVCAVLGESLQGLPLSNVARFDQNFASLCAQLAEMTGPWCVELSDAFEGFAVHTTRKLEEGQSVALAARLLTYKSPAEAVKRHSSELTEKVLETLQRAAASAVAGGNAAYAQRLNSLVAAVKLELNASEERKLLRVAS